MNPLQQSNCSKDIATKPLQRSHSNKAIAKIPLHQSNCNKTIAAETFQRSLQRKRLSGIDRKNICYCIIVSGPHECVPFIAINNSSVPSCLCRYLCTFWHPFPRFSISCRCKEHALQKHC